MKLIDLIIINILMIMLILELIIYDIVGAIAIILLLALHIYTIRSVERWKD